LEDQTTYYARARAINHAAIPTSYTLLGSTRTKTIPGISRVWLGLTSSWNTSTNWSPAGSPSRDDNIVIGVTANDPVMTGSSTIDSITLAAGATLTVQGATFTVRSAVQSDGTLVLSSTETLSLPGGVWDIDSGTVSYRGTGAFTSLTAGTSYFNLQFDNAAGDWALDSFLQINGSFSLAQGNVNALSTTLTVDGNLIRIGGTFDAGSGTVNLSGNGLVSGFSGVNALNNVALAGPAQTTMLGSDLEAEGTIVFGGGSVNEVGGPRALVVASALAIPISITAGTDMNFSTLTWTTSNTAVEIPAYVGYPALTLQSNAAAQSTVFRLAGNVAASTVAVYQVGSATNAVLNVDGYTLTAERLEIGYSTDTGHGAVVLGNGVLNVAGDIRFLSGRSVFDLGTSTAVNVGGDFLYGGSTGTFRTATSTINFVGNGAQLVNVFGGNLSTVYAQNTSSSGVTFTSSFSVVNLNAGGLSSATTIYFTGRSTVNVTGRLNLDGSAGRYVVLRSTAAGVAAHLIVGAERTTADFVDVRDNDASGSPQIIATNSIDSGNNRNWDFAAPATIVLSANAGPARRDITLSWPAPADDGASGAALSGSYYIQYSTMTSVVWSTSSAQIVIGTSGVTPGVVVSTTVGRLMLGSTYYFRQIAVDDVARWSGYSNIAQLMLSDTLAPAAVTNLVAANTSNEGEISLQWTAPDSDGADPIGEPAASYDVRYSTLSVAGLAGNTTAWWNLASTLSSEPAPALPGATETLLITAPDYGVTYYYAIRSVDPSNNLSDIDVKAASPALQANAYGADFNPPAVGNFQAIGSQSQVTLTWNAVNVPDFSKYQLYRGLDPSALTLITEFTVPTQSAFIDLGLVNGVTYYYQMVTVDRGSPAFPGVALTSATAIINTTTLQQLPNAPVISATDTVSPNNFAIRWGWTLETPPVADGFRFYVSSVDISGVLSPAVTSYMQLSLQPNQRVTAQVGAYNNAGMTLSTPFTRYVLANAPVNSLVTGVSDFTVGLDWSENGNVGSPTYQITYALNAGFTSATTVQTTLSQATLNNLQPETLYYIRVRALNGDGVATDFDLTLTTTTDSRQDRLANAPPGGMWATQTVSGGQYNVTVSWDPVTTNANGTPATDLAGYMVHVGTSWLMDEGDWNDTVITTTFTTLTVNASPRTYIAVRAVDTSGNQSLTSSVVSVPDLKYYAVADDRESWFEYSAAMANQLRRAWSANNNVGYTILGHEFVEHYGNGKVIKSVRFRAYRTDTMRSVSDRMFQQAEGSVNIVYSVVGNNIVQGTPSRESYFEGLLQSGGGLRASADDKSLLIADNGDGDRSVRTRAGVDRIGASIMPNQSVSKKMSVFWNNGADWIKMGGAVDQSAQVAMVRTSRLGSYQLRQASQLGDASLVQVYPRIFTPNGDGANDIVIFQFGEISLEDAALTGEIFDLTGAKVADLRPGPDPISTLKWDGKSDSGSTVPAGIYVYQIKANGVNVNGTVVVAR
jgi:hypothetical protein